MDLQKEIKKLSEQSENEGDMTSFYYLELFDVMATQHSKLEQIKNSINYFNNNKFAQATAPFGTLLIKAIEEIIEGQTGVLETFVDPFGEEKIKYVFPGDRKLHEEVTAKEESDENDDESSEQPEA